MIEDFIMERLIPIVILSVSTLMVWILIWSGFHAVNEAECLKRGYPEAATSWNLNGYCKNIDGAVTSTVHKL